MDRRQIGLKLAMDCLDLEVEVDEFNDRLILQKATYLAQAAGVHLGYFYRWYLRGPYSPAVADDGFALNREIKSDCDDSQSWELDEVSSKRLSEIKKLIGRKNPQRARKLELLASVHFLVDQKQVSKSDPDLITEKLHRFNKQFTKSEVEKSLGQLREYGLLS
jgi:uncharacterized protein YwgA